MLGATCGELAVLGSTDAGFRGLVFVDVQIDILAERHDTLAVNSLYRWLLRDRDLSRCGAVSLGGEAAPGEMGLPDVINVVLTQTTGLLTLALSYLSWRDSRSKAPPVRITVGVQSVILSDESPDDAEREVAALLPDGHTLGDSGAARPVPAAETDMVGGEA